MLSSRWSIERKHIIIICIFFNLFIKFFWTNNSESESTVCNSFVSCWSAFFFRNSRLCSIFWFWCNIEADTMLLMKRKVYSIANRFFFLSCKSGYIFVLITWEKWYRIKSRLIGELQYSASTIDNYIFKWKIKIYYKSNQIDRYWHTLSVYTV